ncbi:MAG TPA: phosphate acyltransferase PlsX [Gammaproteobacteria bacterium]|nr:phosphate acyltransferase PlsX [Gammaproteobacteria bacterium]
MAQRLTISLDAMGGDHGPDVVVPAALHAAGQHPDLHQILVGDEGVLREALERNGAGTGPSLSIRHASQTVGMDEPPSKALRNKKDSSMRVAIDLVKEGSADACVSAGNTGALMATARFVLKTIGGIDRPAISSAIPSIYGHTYMLDLGANTECTPEQLFQFAAMGSVLVTAVNSIDAPRVGLLNIGEEEIKGIEAVRRAAQLLSQSSLNYVGFVEGDDIYTGEVDVVVCDGFVGNVALKTSEGLAKLVGHYVREEFSSSVYSRLAALVAWPVLRRLRSRMDPRRYNGASLLGLQGIVIKSHGGADTYAFANAISMAMLEVKKSVPKRIGHLVASAMADVSERET